MITGRGKRDIPIGSTVTFELAWVNKKTDTPADLDGLTASVEISNIHKEFKIEETFVYENQIEIEPNDIEGNKRKGVVKVNLTAEMTNKFQTPKNDPDPYLTSGYYGLLVIRFSNGFIGAVNIVRPFKTSK